MILRRLAVRDFRRFERFEVGFAPGLNVVVGTNEAGKSTLREAITLALFQDPKTTDRKVLGLRRWRASSQFAVELEFEADGRSYLLAKDFQARTARLEERGSGETLEDARAVERRIKELLGLGSRATFESTVRVSQREITQLRDGPGIADSLQKLVTGGEQDIQASRVLEELDRALGALRTTSSSNPGPLAVLPGRLAAKESAAALKRQSLARAEEARAGLAAAQEALAETRRDLEEKEAVERDCAERFRLEDELAKAREAEERLLGKAERAAALEEAVARAERELERYAAVLAVPSEQAAEVASLEVQAARAAAPSADLAAQAGRPPLRVAWLAAAAGLALVGLVGGALYPPLLALLLIGVGLLAWELRRARSGAVDEAALAVRIRAEEQQRSAESAAARLSAVLAAAGCGQAAEFRAKRLRAEELRRQLGEDRARLEGLLAGQTLADVEAERRAASRRARDLAERLDEPRMRLAKLDQVAYRRLTADIEGLRARVDSLGKQVEDLRVTVLANQAGVDEVHSLEEEAQELRDQLAAAEERQQVLRLARQVLDEARLASMVSAKDVLEGELGGLIAEITGGRYRQVVVDPSKLSIQVLSPDRGELVGASLDGDLSTGTVEQLYLAARLAIARLLAGGRRPPFILDDPFVTFDGTRTKAALALCKRLSAEHQVLLFTCHQAYRAAADHVVELPALAE